MTEDVKELQTLAIVLFKKVEELTQENADLKRRLSKYENPKNSNNSSVPLQKMRIAQSEKACVRKVGLNQAVKKDEREIRSKWLKSPISQKPYSFVLQLLW